MKNHCLFLQGDTRSGKSTLLLDVLKPYLQDIGGFFVQRMQDNGLNRAFCLQAVNNQSIMLTIPYDPKNNSIFIQKTSEGWRQDSEVFTKTGGALLKTSILEHKKMILMDEIGGIELLSKDFRRVLYQTLEGTVPCIGVLKSIGNKAKMEDKLSIEYSYEQLYRKLHADIIHFFDGEIVTMTRENKAFVRNKIEIFLGLYF